MAAPLNAVKLLRSRLNFLIKAVESSAEVRANHDFMRRLNQIVNQVPIASRDYYDSQVLQEYSETQILNLMATVTKSTTQIQSLIETFNSYQKVMEFSGSDNYKMGGGMNVEKSKGLKGMMQQFRR